MLYSIVLITSFIKNQSCMSFIKEIPSRNNGIRSVAKNFFTSWYIQFEWHERLVKTYFGRWLIYPSKFFCIRTESHVFETTFCQPLPCMIKSKSCAIKWFSYIIITDNYGISCCVSSPTFIIKITISKLKGIKRKS